MCNMWRGHPIQNYQIFSGVNCTQADLEAIIDGNDDVVLLGLDTNKLYYEYTYKFKCSETGMSFMNTDTDEYQTYVTATCQANKTWSISSIPYECECEYKDSLKQRVSLLNFCFRFPLHLPSRPPGRKVPEETIQYFVSPCPWGVCNVCLWCWE